MGNLRVGEAFLGDKGERDMTYAPDDGEESLPKQITVDRKLELSKLAHKAVKDLSTQLQPHEWYMFWRLAKLMQEG